MDWVFEHLQVVILVAVAIAAALQKLKQSRTLTGAELPPAADDNEAERTRRIQEEIRRRILERRGQAPTPPLAEDQGPAFPPAPPMIDEVRPVVVPAPVLVPLGLAPMPDFLVEAERQRLLKARMEELQSTEWARLQTVPAAFHNAPSEEPGAVRGNELIAALRSGAGLRQAMVLREIIDPPLGLRPPESPGQGIWTRM